VDLRVALADNAYMDVLELAIPDVKVLVPKKFGDHRGFFSEVYSRRACEAAGIATEFVQDNHSLSGPRGTVRALHYQLAPMAQAKLVRVTRGTILDVAVDIRRSSPTFGRQVSCELSAANWKQMWIPVGFAHGFVTLEPDTEVIYKVTEYYSPQHERGIRWNDPDLAIDWGIDPVEAVLSGRDTAHPFFKDQAALFD
jgi:dTDP-4-dehydrorhamnose 3,5-epimerase